METGVDEPCGETCDLVAAGHGVTYAAARLHRQATPWRVTVAAVDGQHAALRYDDFPSAAVEEVWWHRPLSDHLTVGQSLRRRHPGILQSDDGDLLYVQHQSGTSLHDIDPEEGC